MSSSNSISISAASFDLMFSSLFSSFKLAVNSLVFSLEILFSRNCSIGMSSKRLSRSIAISLSMTALIFPLATIAAVKAFSFITFLAASAIFSSIFTFAAAAAIIAISFLIFLAFTATFMAASAAVAVVADISFKIFLASLPAWIAFSAATAVMTAISFMAFLASSTNFFSLFSFATTAAFAAIFLKALLAFLASAATFFSALILSFSFSFSIFSTFSDAILNWMIKL
mmetsp:Transcript_10599/g.12145  ORF Transcript_10599/g.12145 Transcript_10599/m.12145 type:complete len:228 (-) Transcript_10599:243-926(-)